MAVQGEDIASKIEERVKQTVDAVVGDIRGSIEDVREIVDQQFEAVLQSILADAKTLKLRGELEELLAGISAGPAAAEPPAAPTAAPGKALRDLKESIQEIERGGTQVDVLNALLDQLLGFGSRAALLILKGDAFSGWKGKGFAAFGGNDETIKRFTAAPGDVTELDRLRLDERVVSWNGASFAQRANMAAPASAIAIPMVIKDKIAAAVYVDRMPGSDSVIDQAAVELLVFTTGLLIDTLAIRKKVPSPTLSRQADAEPFEPEAEPTLLTHPEAPISAGAEPPPPAPSQEKAPEPPSTFTDVAPPESQPAPPSRVEPPSAPQPRPPEPEAPSEVRPPERLVQIRPPAEQQPPVREEAPSHEAVPPPSPPEPPKAQPSTQVRPPGSTQYVPPPGVEGGFAARAEAGEDAKKHDDARRFARLLVSEIKLYNEGKVDQGRKNGDLYARLKEDIDRSRQMYDDRVPEEVREVSNYFYDELVRILADGNSDALGL